MRMKVWSPRGTSDESPLWRDLETQAKTLETMARTIRKDLARRNPTMTITALGNLMRQSQTAYDEVGQLLGEAGRPTATKAPAFEV